MAGLVPVPTTPRPLTGGSPAWLPAAPLPIRGWNEPEPEPAETQSLNTGVSGGGTAVYNTPAFGAPARCSWRGRFRAGFTITADYQTDSATPTSETGTAEVPPIKLNLLPLITGVVAAGSVRLRLNGRTYVDRQGDLVYSVDPQTNAGQIGGTIDYTTGEVTIEDWAAGSFDLQIESLGVINSEAPTNRLFFRTPAAPIAQASLTVQANTYLDGALIQATADQNGEIDGPNIRGFVDVENGIVEVFFGEWVAAAGNEGEWWYNADAIQNGDIFKPVMIVPGTAFFSAVALTSIPLDPQILGLDPILLPSDGRVPVFQPGDSLMLVQRNVTSADNPAAGGTHDTGLKNVSWVRVRDSSGANVLSEHYSLDSETGMLQWANPLELDAYTGPFEIAVLSYAKRLCSDVQIDGTISLATGAPFDMDPNDADIYLCSKLILLPDGGTQDLQALYTNLFSQSSWTSEWSDDPIGDPTTGQYDDINYPIEMSNNGSITERWRIQFVGSDTVNVIGERFGQVLTSVPISEEIAPVNPATSTPYFKVAAGGWSGGWSTGNVVRFNTLGANDPVWIIRSTQPGDSPGLPSDRFIAHLQGDVAQEED